MYDLETYLATKDNLSGPVYVSNTEDQPGGSRRIFDEHGRETLGSTIGRVLSFAILIGLIFYLWAH